MEASDDALQCILNWSVGCGAGISTDNIVAQQQWRSRRAEAAATSGAIA